MGSVTFSSPGQMILAGIGILILGIVLLGFGIGFIGAIFGIWWIIKGIAWNSQITSNQQRAGKINQINQQNKLRIQQIMHEVDRYVNMGDYNNALGLLDHTIYDPNLLSNQGKHMFLKMAADICTRIPNYEQAQHYNQEASR